MNKTTTNHKNTKKSKNTKAGGARNNNNKNRNRNNKNRNRNYHSRNKKKQNLSPLEVILNKHDFFHNQLIEARKKLFDYFGRYDGNRKEKLFRTYYNAMEALRKFEDEVPEEFKDAVLKRFDFYKNDEVYSKTLEESDYTYSDPSSFSEEEFKDPHYLLSQRNSSFEEDTEESVGSSEDYKKYKGL